MPVASDVELFFRSSALFSSCTDSHFLHNVFTPLRSSVTDNTERDRDEGCGGHYNTKNYTMQKAPPEAIVRRYPNSLHSLFIRRALNALAFSFS